MLQRSADHGSSPAMLAAVALLLACQLIGEALSRLTGVPLPGAVLGLMLLVVWLHIRPGERTELKAVASTLIGAFSILFIPATVGLMELGPTLSAYGIALLAACAVSTLLTLVVTAGVFAWVAGRQSGSEP